MNISNLIINLVIFITIIYGLFGFILYFNQKSFIYFPNNQDFYDCEGFREYEILNYKGTRFYFKSGDKEKSNEVIVYYHGNAGSACDRSENKYLFEKTNKSLIFVEYAGFSNDKIKPSKQLILNDVKNIIDFIEEKKFKKIIIYGESLGSAVGSYHANIGKVDKLILVTPFSSINDIARTQYPIYPIKFLLKENYDNIKWLNNFESDVFILHGSNDSIIPKKFSKKLYNNIKTKNKKYILIEGFDHNNLWLSKEFNDRLKEILIK